MRLSTEDVRKVASLAKLEISEANLELMSGKLLSVLTLVDQLQQVDTTGVEEMAHPVDVHSVVRLDLLVAVPSPESEVKLRESALRNAPRTDGEFFLVPPVLG